MVLWLCVGILAAVVLIVFRRLDAIRDDMQWFQRRLTNLEKVRYQKYDQELGKPHGAISPSQG